jgi:hypothetical protein
MPHRLLRLMPYWFILMVFDSIITYLWHQHNKNTNPGPVFMLQVMVQMEKIITGAASGTIPVYWFGVCCSQ